MKKVHRLFSMIEELSKNLKVCISSLVLKYGVTERTLQSDFALLVDYFGEKLVKKGACYTLLNQEQFSQIFRTNPQTLKRFLYLVSVVDTAFYEDFVHEYHELLQELN